MDRYEDFSKKRLHRIFSEFVAKFPRESTCINKVLSIRKRKQGSLCQNCNESENLMFLWEKKKIRCKKCGNETAFAFGTIFYNSKVPIVTWLRLIWLWSRSPSHSNAKKVGVDLGVPASSSFECIQKVRRMLTTSKNSLCGNVEVDLLSFRRGGLSAYYSLAKNKKMICIAVHARKNGPGQIRMEVIEDFNLQQYFEFRRKHLGGNTTENRGALLLNKTTGELIKYEVTKGGATEYSSLPSVNKIAKELDDWLWDNFHGSIISSPDLQYYLDEFCFRRNNRYNKEGRKDKYYLFEQVLENAVYFKDTIEEERDGKDVEVPEESHSIPVKVG